MGKRQRFCPVVYFIDEKDSPDLILNSFKIFFSLMIMAFFTIGVALKKMVSPFSEREKNPMSVPKTSSHASLKAFSVELEFITSFLNFFKYLEIGSILLVMGRGKSALFVIYNIESVSNHFFVSLSRGHYY